MALAHIRILHGYLRSNIFQVTVEIKEVKSRMLEILLTCSPGLLNSRVLATLDALLPFDSIQYQHLNLTLCEV